MSRIRHIRGSRFATAGIAATTTTLLAAALAPTASADTGPSRATAISNAASVLVHQAPALGLTSDQGTGGRDVVGDAVRTLQLGHDRTFRHRAVRGGDFLVHLAPGRSYRSAGRDTQRDISV